MLLNQSPTRGTVFNPANMKSLGSEDQEPVIKYLSESITCVKSLISMILVLAPGEEFILTNLSWIMLHRGLSFAIRFDMATTLKPIAHLTEHLHRLLDLRHILRQIVLRLESAISLAEDDTGDRDTFYHLCRRARGLEKWYLDNYHPLTGSHSGGSDESPVSSLGMTESTEMNIDITLNNLPQFVFSEAIGPDVFFGNEGFDDFSTIGLDISPNEVFGMYSDQPGTFGD